MQGVCWFPERGNANGTRGHFRRKLPGFPWWKNEALLRHESLFYAENVTERIYDRYFQFITGTFESDVLLKSSNPISDGNFFQTVKIQYV